MSGQPSENQDRRTPRPARLTERIYRVQGYEFQTDPYVTTWTYKRLADAEWRAGHVQRLTDFSVADIEWKPMPSRHFGSNIAERSS